jgi:hypothetical protein
MIHFDKVTKVYFDDSVALSDVSLFVIVGFVVVNVLGGCMFVFMFCCVFDVYGGKLMVARVVTGDDAELLAVSKDSQVIRTEISSIPTLGRDTQGVRIMKLRDGDSVASFNLL